MRIPGSRRNSELCLALRRSLYLERPTLGVEFFCENTFLIPVDLAGQEKQISEVRNCHARPSIDGLVVSTSRRIPSPCPENVPRPRLDFMVESCLRRITAGARSHTGVYMKNWEDLAQRNCASRARANVHDRFLLTAPRIDLAQCFVVL